MTIKGVTFNSVHSNVHHLRIESSRRPLVPETKDIYVEVPHRDSSILIPDGSKKDVFVEVVFVIMTPEEESVFSIARGVASWLLTDDRAPLVFDDDPGYTYSAKLFGNIELEKIITLGRFTAIFRCEPFFVEEEGG